MAADSFVHLHVHSEYSMLDGAARVGELIQAAKEQAMPAVAAPSSIEYSLCTCRWTKESAATELLTAGSTGLPV